MNFGKFKIAAHVALGVILLVIFHNLLYRVEKDNLIWIGVVICVGFSAGVIEFLQPKLKLGTATFGGAMRTCICLVPYIIYQIIRML